MELANVFEFINPETIRIKGTRVGIEIVIEKFIDGASPKEIQRHYPHLTLKQIYATITYYLLNKDTIDAYIEVGREQAEAAYEVQRRNPPPGVKRLMKTSVRLKHFVRLKVRFSRVKDINCSTNFMKFQ